MNVAIVKYNGGNTQSVAFALERLGVSPVITNDAELLSKAEKVIFPGVGEAGCAMRFLQQHSLDKLILSLKQPVLGICLGMQLLCRHSEEGDTPCLGIFDVEVKRFTEGKVPHMGWNTIAGGDTSLTNGLSAGAFFYFVHSYYAGECADTVAVTEYGRRFSSILQKDNFYGVQFHPEKSAGAGETLIKNFLDI